MELSSSSIRKAFLIFQEVTFQAQKMKEKKTKKNALKMFLIFREIELSSQNLKKFLIFHIFQTSKAPKTNKTFAPKKFLASCDVYVIFTAVKHREIPCDYLYSSKV